MKNTYALAVATLILAGISYPQGTIFFQEDFNSVQAGNLPPGWTLGDGGAVDASYPPYDSNLTWSVINYYSSSSYTLGNGRFLFIRYNNAGQRDTITTPSINAVTGPGISFIFLIYKTYYRHSSQDTGIVEVFNGTNWVKVKEYTSTFGGWGPSAAIEKIDITPYANANLQVRFIYIDHNDWYWAIDSVVVEGLACLTPDVSLSQTFCGSDTVLASWPSSYPGDSVAIEYGPHGFTPGSGTRITVINDTFYKFTGISLNVYDFYVWGWCSGYPSDTLLYSKVVGDKEIIIKINTQSYGGEVFWKLLDSTTNTLVASVSPATYSSNSTYYHSGCVIKNKKYKFEAWDSYGDGWEGGTYKVMIVAPCGDTVILANNNGNTPNNGTTTPYDLEDFEYFVVPDIQIPTVTITGPSTCPSGQQCTYTATGSNINSYQWSTGETTVSITYTASGTGQDTLWVTVYNGPCSATDSIVIDIGTGIATGYAKPDLPVIYLNSENSKLIIDNTHSVSAIKHLKITDLTGRIIMELNDIKEKQKVITDMPETASSIYIATGLMSNGRLFHYRLLNIR